METLKLMKMRWNSLRKNRKGQGTTEYVIILALVAGLAILLWNTINPKMKDRINAIGAGLDSTKTN